MSRMLIIVFRRTLPDSIGDCKIKYEISVSYGFRSETFALQIASFDLLTLPWLEHLLFWAGFYKLKSFGTRAIRAKQELFVTL
jgi:hypothetical protein